MGKKSKWGFKMQGEKSAEVYIYEEIGEFWGLSAKDFATELNDLGDIENLSVRINSMGGSVFDGFTIHNALKQHPAKVTVQIDGIAASIASVIAMAGDSVQIAENGFVMIHEPWTIMLGTAKEFRQEADVLDKLQDQAVQSYVNKTGLAESEVVEMLDGKETWMNADEALEKGFADQKTEASKAAALGVDRNLFPNAPAALKHRAISPQARKAIDQATADREAESVAVRMRVLEVGQTA